MHSFAAVVVCFSWRVALLVQELREAAAKAQETCGSLEIDGAIDQVHGLQRELEELRKTASMGQLVPLPGQTAENCATQLATNSKSVGSAMAQLLTAAAQVSRLSTSLSVAFSTVCRIVFYCICACFARRAMRTTRGWRRATRRTRSRRWRRLCAASRRRRVTASCRTSCSSTAATSWRSRPT